MDAYQSQIVVDFTRHAVACLNAFGIVVSFWLGLIAALLVNARR